MIYDPDEMDEEIMRERQPDIDGSGKTKAQADVLRDLRALRRKLAEVPGWYLDRRRLLLQGRKLGIFHRELGAAAGISETAVIKEVQKPE